MKRIKRKNFLTPLPPNTRLVTRAGRSLGYGNPYSVKEYGREESLRLYRIYLMTRLYEDPAFLEPLKGYNLACYCKLDEPCHADIILEYIEET
jgi:hypothetical protein